MEVLVRLVDKGPGEDASKRGDVIAVQPDGFAWSQEELTNNYWLVMVVTSLLNTDRDSMLFTRSDFPRGRLRRREWFVDFSVLALPNRFNFPRTQQKVTITRAGFIASLKQKPALV